MTSNSFHYSCTQLLIKYIFDYWNNSNRFEEDFPCIAQITTKCHIKKKCAAIGLFRLSSLVLASARLLLSFGSRKSHHTSLSILLFMWKFAWIKFMLSHRKDTRWNHSVSNFIISKREIQSFPSTYRESCRLRHPVLVSSTASFGRIGCDRGVASDLKTARMLCYRRQRRSFFGEAFEVGQDCGGSELGVVFSAGSQCLVFRYSTECLEK